ncbi:MAG: SPFH/Band 7/PHB domain protein [Candidatus Babeliaceae bacterium]|nr:SPFH/Band 7/PHB domain protein [Candidatus Babeliaceae bacterium]
MEMIVYGYTGFGIIFLGSLIVLLGLFLLKSIYLVQQAEAVVIERFGKYHRTLGAGIHFVVPFMDAARVVSWTYFKEEARRYYRYIRNLSVIDLREAVYDFPKQNVITKDNVTMEISALLYYQVTDPKRAVYEVSNLPEAIEKLTHSTLRNVIGSMDLDESLVSRDQINMRLRLILDEASDKWGVKVNRVELQEVNPPADIRSAMEKQMRAERDRRAVILEAEGLKQAAILEAEGKQQSQVLAARGQAESRLINAEAEAQARLKIALAETQAIERLQNALPNGDSAQYMLTQQYIKMLPSMMEGKDNKMIVVPYEAAGAMSSLATIKELFNDKK